MIIAGVLALVALFSLGGGASALWWELRVSELKDRVETVVVEEARQDQAKTVLDGAVSVTQKNEELIKKTMDRYLEVASKKASTPQDFEQAVLEWRANSHNIDLALVDLRFELKKVVNQEEWAKLFPAAEDVTAAPGEAPAPAEE